MSNNAYTADAIVTDEGLQVMRRRPTQYLPNTEHAGITHAIVEVQDNSFDEATLMGPAGEVDILLCPDPKRKTFQCVIRDNGRGIPLSKLVPAFTVPHTSGKYSTDTYKYSSGLFGVGAKVSAGLSNKFRAISCRGKEGSASLFVECGQHATKPALEKKAIGSGMTVVMEPDATIFQGVETYAEGAWSELLERIKKYAYFNTSHVRFLLGTSPLPDSVWTIGNNASIALVREHIASAQVVFDSDTFNREDWLRKYLGVIHPFTWNHHLERVPDKVSSLAYSITLYYSDKDRGGNRLGMLNGVPIDGASSDHLSEVTLAATMQLSKHIQDKHVRAFFIESYKLPLYMAVSVKYEGAEFTGTTKNSYTNKDFRQEYGTYIRDALARGSGKGAIAELYELLAEDIQEKYLASLTGQTKAKHKGRLYQDLNYPDKFTDCTTTDRSQAELFIVEGDSAGGGVKGIRNGETQGIYTVRGKPFNALKKADAIDSASAAILADLIYQDIIRIIGLDPHKPDLNSLYFSRILITADADADGKHIVSVLIGNLYALCPEYVLSGRIQIVVPPYYGITYRGSKKKQYITDKVSLVHWFTQNVYKPAFDIEVSFAHPDPKTGCETQTTFNLTNSEYDSFVQHAMVIGDVIQNLSKEMVLDPLILEMLTHTTQYLVPGKVDPNHIKELLGVDKVIYDPHGHILTLAIGRDDFTVPLYQVTERLYEQLIPMLQRLHWRKMEIYITSKKHDGFKRQWVTIGQLHAILKNFDSLFHIKQYKGLGGMDPEDCYTVCMDPNHRTVYPITSVSDVESIFNLLGRDSEHRKKLLIGQTKAA